MSLSVRIRHRQGAFLLDAAFESSGRLTALFGPSGSGKTSLINMVGGLVRPENGRIEAGGRLLVDTDARIFVPKHRRRIGYVFQDARLFPHMTVAQNLGYGRFFTPAAERYADFSGVVDLLGIGHLLSRKPASLSGGEKQRVAIGRALIASPKLILMDEPLASLDDARKAEIMPYIERLRDETKIPIVYVSHSVGEVARLATDVVVLSAGKVVASGPAAGILARFDLLPEEQRAEAGAMVDLTVAGQEEEFGLTVLRSASGEWRLPRIDAPVGAKIRVRVRARDVMLSLERPAGISALNVLPGKIAAISADAGSEALVSLDCGGDRLAARVTRRSVETLGLAVGVQVFAVVKAVTFDRGTIGNLQHDLKG
ncbi:molybdenum ABC transporter ATP-binding protein [Mesorhizobium sp. LHD-90]|uniref:molybdenum ABC transporter ATP-binding protein n=1 Tax=Mesorhizobium sp. LHD-90 TaxID=3071414 RepID=UPI0027E16272|nr:molybdenum ABC transporter ATP-binding protein [Mesorhizobium sp. LHD-90]MDQ6433280.1 molybdenum ABC transporter ATP-binding protein [Mesorhizobium sp. LHD-90]